MRRLACCFGKTDRWREPGNHGRRAISAIEIGGWITERLTRVGSGPCASKFG